MKIRIFTNEAGLVKMEYEINEFIKDKKVLFAKQSESANESGCGFTISVFYEEENNNGK